MICRSSQGSALPLFLIAVTSSLFPVFHSSFKSDYLNIFWNIFEDLFYYFRYINVLPARMYVCHMLTWCLWKSEEDIRFPGLQLQLWVTMGGLGIKPGFSTRAAWACWATCLASFEAFQPLLFWCQYPDSYLLEFSLHFPKAHCSAFCLVLVCHPWVLLGEVGWAGPSGLFTAF
jgi:hypothetical protein